MAVAIAALLVAPVAFLFGVLIAWDLIAQRDYHALVSGRRDWVLAVGLLVGPALVWAGVFALHAARVLV